MEELINIEKIQEEKANQEDSIIIRLFLKDIVKHIFVKTGMRIYNLEKTLNSTFLLKFKDMLKINFFENLLFNSYTSVFLTLLNLSALRIKKVLGNGISDFKNALIIVNSVAKSVNKKAVQRSSVMLIIVKNIN